MILSLDGPTGGVFGSFDLALGSPTDRRTLGRCFGLAWNDNHKHLYEDCTYIILPFSADCVIFQLNVRGSKSFNVHRIVVYCSPFIQADLDRQ